MDTSTNNSISKNEVVTPDGVIQRTENLGYIIEAKKSLPDNDGLWLSIVRQLQKYDDDLLGWWTDDERISTSSVILLIEISRAMAFSRYLLDLQEIEGVNFSNPFAVVEFTRADEVDQYLFIRKHRGEIAIDSDNRKRVLDDGVKVPMEKVVGTYGEKKFYDSEPVTEHTMLILWQVLFTEKKSETQYNEQERAWLIPVHLDDLKADLQRLYGSQGSEPRGVEFPLTEWVRKAMDAFVVLNLASKGNENKEYTVHFRRIKGDVLERFVGHRSVKKATLDTSKAKQLTYLPEANATA
jgi:hypothetical protein